MLSKGERAAKYAYGSGRSGFGEAAGAMEACRRYGVHARRRRTAVLDAL
jgi:hypothetical protein